jgi:hypothetical protein
MRHYAGSLSDVVENPGEFVEFDEPVLCTFEFGDGRVNEREIGLVGRKGILYTKTYGFACWTSLSEGTKMRCMGEEYVSRGRSDPGVLEWAKRINQFLRGENSYSIEDEMDIL